MRIDSTISTQINKTTHSIQQNKIASVEQKQQLQNDNTISTLKHDWKNKIRNMDLDIKELQNTLSQYQAKKDLFVDIQTELLSFSGNNADIIEKKINNTIDKYSFNNKLLYDKVHFNSNNEVYKFGSKIEIEKNQVLDALSQTQNEIKSKLISKENLFFASTHIERVDLNASVEAQTKYILSLTTDFKVNTDYLKKLFS